MDTQPKIPTLKDSQKPQVKVRGLEAGVTLFDRLKQFKKKDLAFILAGLGTLFMAPLAEHFMMSPESGDGTLQQGTRGKGFFDGSGGNPYEVGSNNGMAPGGPVGGGSDIITPLNVRDPSALVMGPGATQQPPTNSVMPSTPPPTAPSKQSDSDLRDALAAGGRGAAAAVKKALLPIPKIALAGSGGLRGLGVANGGSNASAGPISSAGLVSGKSANGGSMPGIRGGHNITGVSRGQANGSGDSAIDALKKKADAAAGLFNRAGAANALDEAARAGIPTGNGGGSGGAGSGSGSTDKATGGDQNKDGKNVGESLAFLKAKAIQDAQIELWKKEQEAGDTKLELLKIRNTSAETFFSTLAGDGAKKLSACLFKGFNSTDCMTYGGATSYSCAFNNTGVIVQMGDVATDGHCEGKTAKGGESSPNKLYYLDTDGTTLIGCTGTSGAQKSPLTGCTTNGTGPKNKPKPPVDTGTKDLGFGVAGDMSNATVTGMGDACKTIQGLQDGLKAAAALTPPPPNAADLLKAAAGFDPFLGFAAGVVSVRDAVGSPAGGGGKGTIADCKATAKPISSDPPLLDQVGNTSGNGIVGALVAPQNGVLAQMDDQSTKTDLEGLKPVTNAGSEVVKNIGTFVKDVNAVKDFNQKLKDSGYDTNPDPLGLDKLTVLLNNITEKKGAEQTATTKKAVVQIQKVAVMLNGMVDNLDHAANKDLGPQVANANQDPAPLKGSIGQDGSVALVMTRHGELDEAMKTEQVEVPPSKLKKPVPADKEDLTKDAAPTQKEMQDLLKTAAEEVKKTQANVKAFNALPDAEKAAKLQETQDDINKTGLDVRKLQADQKAIDAGISTAANDAAKWVGVGDKK